MSRSKIELDLALSKAKREIESLKSRLTEMRIHASEGWTRADIFEAALKSEQNYHIASNSHWYRKGLKDNYENR